jgi:cytochrome c oxidase cbb3-type subunit III
MRTLKLKILLAATLPAFLPNLLLAGGLQGEKHTILSNAAFLVMLSIIVLLMFVILGMAEMVKAGAMLGRLRERKEKEARETGTKNKIAGAIIIFCVAPALAFAQGEMAHAADTGFNYWRMGADMFYLLLSIIVFELFIIYMLFRSGMQLLRGEEKIAAAKIARAEKEVPSFLEKLNRSVAVSEENAILMDHDYDGIRELDNDLPPWWRYGFYATVVFSIVYLFHFHVLHTGKSSLEEYRQELADGERKVAAYKKTAANLVDESSVILLTDEGSLSEGARIYKENCVACHGDHGEGKIGPNFCDDYWMHGGSVQDVFKSVKYGWTDKGMKAWQQDLKPIEIQLVTSYVKSLRGTNPAGQKEKQGELYTEDQKSATDTAGKAHAVPLKDSLPNVK